MKTYIIPQKQSNTGSIHDIASDMYDREINFPAGTKYAVVLSSYYGGRGYTTHRTKTATITQAKKMRDWSHIIMDVTGVLYCMHDDNLYPV